MDDDDQIPERVPFTLVCEECDAGMDMESREQALAAGWTGICYAPDLPQANFVGLCPACRQWQDEEEARRAAARATQPPQ